MATKLSSPLPLVEVAAASVLASYGASNLLDKGTDTNRKCIKCEMRNDTDASVYVSNNGGTNNHWYLEIGEAKIIDDAQFNDVRVKRSGTPSTGSVRFTFYMEA